MNNMVWCLLNVIDGFGAEMTIECEMSHMIRAGQLERPFWFASEAD